MVYWSTIIVPQNRQRMLLMKEYELKLDITQEIIDKSFYLLSIRKTLDSFCEICPMALGLTSHFNKPMRWGSVYGRSVDNLLHFNATTKPKIVMDFDERRPCTPCKIKLVVSEYQEGEIKILETENFLFWQTSNL